VGDLIQPGDHVRQDAASQFPRDDGDMARGRHRRRSLPQHLGGLVQEKPGEAHAVLHLEEVVIIFRRRDRLVCQEEEFIGGIDETRPGLPEEPFLPGGQLMQHLAGLVAGIGPQAVPVGLETGEADGDGRDGSHLGPQGAQVA